MIRSSLILTALLVLTGCASRGVQDCNSIAGKGWQHLSAAPADRAELLTRANLPNEADVQWYGQGSDRVMVCDPSNSLVNPGCGGSVAYQFERSGGVWTSRGMLLPLCDDGTLPP